MAFLQTLHLKLTSCGDCDSGTVKLGACKSLNVECKCWMAESEHIAFSERMGVWVFFFGFFLLLSPSHKYMIILSLCLKTWLKNNLATSYYKLHGILAASGMETEKQRGNSERKPFCTSFNLFYSAWLCARSQSAAMFTQVPWHSGPVSTFSPLTLAWSWAKPVARDGQESQKQ